MTLLAIIGISYQDCLAKPPEYPDNLLVFFTGDDCAPCKRMERETFTNPIFHKLLKNHNIDFAIVNINDGKMSQKWKISSTPTIYFLQYSRRTCKSKLLVRKNEYLTYQNISQIIINLYGV